MELRFASTEGLKISTVMSLSWHLISTASSYATPLTPDTAPRNHLTRKSRLSHSLVATTQHLRLDLILNNQLTDHHTINATMADDLTTLFAPNAKDGLEQDVRYELESIMRLHSLPLQELFYKWESYSMKMGNDTLDMDSARALKKDIQESLEKESRSKSHVKIKKERRTGATPRGFQMSDDILGMLEGNSPATPRTVGASVVYGSKRKATSYQTPVASRFEAKDPASSPPEFKAAPSSAARPAERDVGGAAIPFSSRVNAGQVVEILNEHLPAFTQPIAPHPEPRVHLVANSDVKKLSYKPLAMKISEASEILDDRIDEFMTMVQHHHDLEDSAFGSAAEQSVTEIVAVGRIACDSSDGRLNPASLVLETSRRVGNGMRAPLRFPTINTFSFFPGQIVALRGTNASGSDFTVSEILELPLPSVAASTPVMIDSHHARLRGGAERMDDDPPAQPLNIIIASGPYTADDSLAFEPLRQLCTIASDTCADILLLTGPFLDTEHPMIASGDFDLPPTVTIDPDTATLTTLFRSLISAPLAKLARENPAITILLIPSVRDATSPHVSWPQEPLPRKNMGLGLPSQAKIVGNPMTIALNEIVTGISSQDILSELRASECVQGGQPQGGLLARLPKYLVEQRHFFPLYPPLDRSKLPKGGVDNEQLPPGAMLDVAYLKLGEMLNVRPDMFVLPSTLPAFAKVVDSVLVINPGVLSRRKAPGTYARLSVQERELSENERGSKMVGHKVFERARVEIVRI